MYDSLFFFAPIAQLVEQLPLKEKVAGSSPAGGTPILYDPTLDHYLHSFPCSSCKRSFLSCSIRPLYIQTLLI